ncbi:Decaprenyl diphosphate synthase-like [Ostreococcus tauri]|uniref:Alkyl transferase n=1 Tax=Ostreococcus tauri TaxID=70448 RepID=Q00TX6_OSTTA|nr:Decaprenyl diphosphate synthase-like [Ostreococcus tauri]CAL58273.1 Decaprenyl diphosphate synthase-like [Ostreococcus tauri]|eukprot:XP_003083724.1 Decaprenyl diphosphate synthase-like [Ostreococcus tauri]
MASRASSRASSGFGRWFRRLVCAALRRRGVPGHVAVIMDGNRRHARRRGASATVGHRAGAETLSAACEWCFDLGVKVLSVYALSTENFGRAEDELDGLFELATERLEMLGKDARLARHRARVTVSGDLNALPKAVREAAMAVMEATAANDGPILNVCMAYTGREDLARAIVETRKEVKAGRLDASDVNERALERRLYGQSGGAPLPAVDLLVRTSGETRLSDYMLMNCRFAALVFTETLWPDFTFWDMVDAVWRYQRGADGLRRAREVYEARTSTKRGGEDVDDASVVAEVSVGSRKK